MDEVASTLAKIAIEQLLSVHALANMARASGNSEYFETAYGWLPHIERTVENLRGELERRKVREPA